MGLQLHAKRTNAADRVSDRFCLLQAGRSAYDRGKLGVFIARFSKLRQELVHEVRRNRLLGQPP